MTTRPLLARLALTTFLLSACAPFAGPPRPGAPPREWDHGTVLNGRRIAPDCRDTLVLGSVPIPEFHDCQRLRMEGQPQTFGSLVGIFSIEALGPITEAEYRQPQGTPVAHLYNFSKMKYATLGIEEGFNCMYLRLEGDSTWTARFQSRGMQVDCPPYAGQWNGNGGLKVVPTATSDPVPPVARWDQEQSPPLHYVGIKCLDRWCEVGRAGFTPDPSRTGRGKGWYDEQQLAVVDAAGGTMTPGVRAWIVPVPGLDALETPDFFCEFPCPENGGWVHVATTFLDAASPYYENKMNFHAGPSGNAIYLRHHVKPDTSRWESRIISADTTTYHEADRADHESMSGPDPMIPGIARWNWLDEDDTTWTRCAVGCCETTARTMSIPALTDW